MVAGHGRIQQRDSTSALPTVISAPATSAGVIGPIVTASNTQLTVATLVNSNGQTSTYTVPITSSTGITSATPTNSASTATDAASGSSTSATSTASSKADTGKLNILIPAIAAPVAVILIVSLVAFWWFMRRRQQATLEDEPEFVMEGMKEKQLSRPITADSNSSTRELVPTKSMEGAVKVKEVEQSAPHIFNVAKDAAYAPLPLPPPRTSSGNDSRPGSRATDQHVKSKAIPNFSRGPRPNTAGRDAAPSPAPGIGQQERGSSRAGQYTTPGAGGTRPSLDQGGPRQGDKISTMATNPRPAPRPPQTRAGSFSRPLVQPSKTQRGPPAPITTKPSNNSQDETPYQTPAGAYNGSSPISQYSPIIKDMPKFGTSPMATTANPKIRSEGGSLSSINDQGTRKAPPSAIKTGNSPLTTNNPTFSNDDIRARLANKNTNTRMALHSIVATTAATSPATEEPPTPSPRLPPPATRDAPPINYNIPLPTHEPPAPASIQARLNGASISDRRSVVSGLSDDYVDMEVDDNKSDVSSLDEREKWQMQSESDRATSRQAGLGGYSALAPRPPLLSSTHNSETSGSQYSLGYYTKDNGGSNAR